MREAQSAKDERPLDVVSPDENLLIGEPDIYLAVGLTGYNIIASDSIEFRSRQPFSL